MVAMTKPYYVLAFYHLTPIEDPQHEVKQHKIFFKDRDITSRIYISKEGINGQMSASVEDAKAYMEWLTEKPVFSQVKFKIHGALEQAFPHVTVKVREQLVAFDQAIDLDKRGKHVTASEWKALLEQDERPVVLDVRNDYEWDIGHFEGAERPKCSTSREFVDYTDELLTKIDKSKTPVMMYCTGGIRCEYYSAYLKEKGVENVYQLDGGVIQYGLDEGQKHWKGKLFVFDDRLAVPLDEKEEPEVIGKCLNCQSPSDRYYNCANMDCNELFISCSNCLEKLVGCCCTDCTTGTHVRPFAHQTTHKPFRRKHCYL
jgi:UPF0176 protein